MSEPVAVSLAEVAEVVRRVVREELGRLPREWLTLRQVAEHMGVSPRYIRQLRSRAELPEPARPSSLGNVLRWRARDIDAWLEERKGR